MTVEATGRRRDPAVKTLLLVEDNAVIGLSETALLEAEGYRVIHVLSGEDAISVALGGQEAIDLVLMDVDLGRGMDGTEAARKILESREIPVVFLSAHTEPELVAKAESITNYGYILKSAGKTVLLASIRVAFKLHDAYSSLLHKEEELRTSEERYAKAFMGSPFAIIISRESDSAVIDTNDAFTRMFGWKRDEIFGKTALEAGLWEDPATRQAVMARLAAEGSLRDLELRFRRNDGSILHSVTAFDRIELGGLPCVMALMEDVSEAKAKELALREQEAHYRILFNDMSNAVIEEDFSEVKRYLDGLVAGGITDLDAWLSTHLGEVRRCAGTIRIINYNQEYLRYLNETDRSRVATTITTIVPDEALLVLKDEFLTLWRGDRSFAIDCPNYVEGSPVRYLNLRLSLVSGHEADWSRVLVSMSDITREMETERELASLISQKDVLMRELEHRVKNNLNIVSSLLSLEATKLRSADDREVFMSAQSRIRSISLIYDLLSHSAPGDRISCRSYFRDLALLLRETFAGGRTDVALQLDIPEMDIDVKRGVSLGLLVNELLTNSLKYAFPGRGGTVSLSIRREGGNLVLVVEDDGVGAPEGFDWERSPSLGARLVDMLAQQLRGKVEMRTGPGFRTLVTLPLEETPAL